MKNFVLKDIVDRRTGAIYDRVFFPAGMPLPRNIKLFQKPIGMDGRTFRDSNMYTAGRFNPPLDMIVNRLLFLIAPTVSQIDRDRFVSLYNWELRLYQKQMFGTPALRVSVTGNPEDLIPDFGKPRDGLEGEGSKLHAIGNYVCWNLEKNSQLYIAPLMPFELNLDSDSELVLQNDFEMWAIIEGLRDFAIQ